MKIFKRIVFYSICLVSFCPSSNFAQEVPDTTSVTSTGFSSLLNHLQQDEIVEIILESDFKKLRVEKTKRAYQSAKFKVVSKGKKNIFFKSKIKPRGKFRARKCLTPPLKIKFKKKALKAEGFNKLNELKLVIPCSDDPLYEQYIAKEFMAYKIYNLLTNNSFQVQLIKIKFQQSGEKRPGPTKLAFLIEDREELHARLNTRAFPDSLKLLPKDFDSSAYTFFQVFQFMIGNTDWIVPVRHNLEVIQNTQKALIPIPFDFDFSGLVNSHYATPSSRTNLETVQERCFLGNDKTMDELQEAFVPFKEQKEAILSYVLDFKWLIKSDRKKTIRFLEQFYEIIESPELINKYFIDKPDFWKPTY